MSSPISQTGTPRLGVGGGGRRGSVQGARGHGPPSPTDRQHLSCPCSPATRLQDHRALLPLTWGSDGHLSPVGWISGVLTPYFPGVRAFGTRTPVPSLFLGSSHTCRFTCLCEAQADRRWGRPESSTASEQPGLPAGGRPGLRSEQLSRGSRRVTPGVGASASRALVRILLWPLFPGLRPLLWVFLGKQLPSLEGGLTLWS